MSLSNFKAQQGMYESERLCELEVMDDSKKTVPSRHHSSTDAHINSQRM